MKIDPLAILGANLREQAENYLDQLPPLMMWGGFVFQLSTMAYSKLTIQDSWNWVAQARFGKEDKLQYTGKKRPTIKFDCEIYAHFINQSLLTIEMKKHGLINEVAIDPVETLRLQANTRTPLMLVTGAGKVMGFWVLTDLTQTIDSFKPNSTPKHQIVSMTMQFYGFTLDPDDAVQNTASLGFTDKKTKLSDAWQKMKDFIEEHV